MVPTTASRSSLTKILACTKPHDLILDPFVGSGTTAAVAKKLGRHYIGIDKEQTYIDFAKKRLQSIHKLDDTYVQPITKTLPPKISFGDLVAAQIIPVGTNLYDAKGQNKVVVCADGSLKQGSHYASIHQMAAKIKKSPTCNGWTFWHFKKGKNLFPIDILRRNGKIDTTKKRSTA